MTLQQQTQPAPARTSAELAAPVTRPGRQPRRRRMRAAAAPRPLRGMGWPIALSLLPAAIAFGVFYLAPLVVLVVTSLADWNGLSFDFVGLQNFKEMFADDTFWQAVRNTALYCAIGVFVQVPLGVLVGVILAQRIRGWQFFRVALFVPSMISGAAFALVFALFLNPRYGLLNTTLDRLGVHTDQDWLYSTSTALPSIGLTFAFVIGFTVILTMAEIASIPQELYEAAEIDGASPLQRQRLITLPLLRNVIGTLVIIRLLTDLALFDVVYILTSGGPNDSTVSVTLYAYRAYTHSAWGYANAVGVFIVVVGLIFIVGTRRLFRIGERTL